MGQLDARLTVKDLMHTEQDGWMELAICALIVVCFITFVIRLILSKD